MKVYVLINDFDEWYEGIFATPEAAMKEYPGKWTGPITHRYWKSADMVQHYERCIPHWDFKGGNFTIYEEEVKG